MTRRVPKCSELLVFWILSMALSKNPQILSVIHHRQNSLESTSQNFVLDISLPKSVVTRN
jgi:hypothetical protein